MGLLRFVLFIQYLGFLMFLKVGRRIWKLEEDHPSEIRWERLLRENLCLKHDVQVLKHKPASLEKRPL